MYIDTVTVSGHIKATTRKQDCCPADTKYPVLMSLKGEGLVVLFTSETEGTVVASPGNASHGIGFYSRTWIPCANTNAWDRFNGTVTLEAK